MSLPNNRVGEDTIHRRHQHQIDKFLVRQICNFRRRFSFGKHLCDLNVPGGGTERRNHMALDVGVHLSLKFVNAEYRNEMTMFGEVIANHVLDDQLTAVESGQPESLE